MPIYASSVRRSVVPDHYRRSSHFIDIGNQTSISRRPKESPLTVKKRKSSPYPFNIEPTKPKPLFNFDDSMRRLASLASSMDLRKRGSVLLRKYNSCCRGKVSKDREIKDGETLKDQKDKQVTNVNHNRRSEYQRRTNPERSTSSRQSLMIRRTSSDQERSLKLGKNEKDIVLMCQLLLLKTVKPLCDYEDLNFSDEFNHRLDERYFEYYPHIFRYLCGRELLIKLNNNYLEENNFTSSFRGTLVNWLIKVQIYSKITSESLQVAVTLVDMFTSVTAISKTYYQLVGVAGLLIACKVVQRYHPRIKDLCHLTDDSYVPGNVLRMEQIMLEKLDFFVHVPIAGNFYHRGLLACVEVADTNQLESFCSYMFDLILLDPESSGLRPSCKAAAAILIGRFILYPEYAPWTKILHHYCLYTVDQLKTCTMAYVAMLSNVYCNSNFPFMAAVEKYSMQAWKSIAKNEKLVAFIKCPKARADLAQLFK